MLIFTSKCYSASYAANCNEIYNNNVAGTNLSINGIYIIKGGFEVYCEFNLNGGHYTAFAKNIDGNWYDFNDSSVSSESPSNLISGASYLLFYRRREDVPISE